jgi:hypothetical protein
MAWAQELGQDSYYYATSLMHIEEERLSPIQESQSLGTD